MAEVTNTTSTYDYSMIGSFGSDAAQSVNGDMINKIRAAEEKSTINPLTEKIDNIALETEKIDEIKTKISEFEELVNYFDIYNDENVFNQFLFDATGTSAVFDAVDKSALEEGSTQIHVEQLAQKDVYQSNGVVEASLTNTYGNEDIQISIGGASAETINTNGLTLQEIATEINKLDGVSSSVEKISDTEHRLVIKSTEVGSENAITLSGAASVTLGFNEYDVDGITELEVASSHTLTARNLTASVDGVDYDISSNTITLQNGLKMTAVKEDAIGEYSTITISKDTSAITVAAESMAIHYNELTTLISNEIDSTDSVIGDKDALKGILSDIKNMLFQNYGADTISYGAITTNTDDDDYYTHANVTTNDKNIFLFGFELDKSGDLTINTTKLNEIINGEDDNYNVDDLKSLFTGVYENKGLGVQLKEYLDSLDGYNGILTTYENSMNTRKEDWELDKKEELEKLDIKYGIMAEQFSAYSAVIAQMESSFSGLKMMIEQSTAS